MEIIFAGGAHYDIGGYRSLSKYFERIFLIKDNPQNILDNKRTQDVIIDSFDSVECEYVFLCGYARLITKYELEKKVYINVHGALLPKYRGMHSTFYAIMNGEKELGITFHLVDEGMDSGDILCQYSFAYTQQTVNEINHTIDELVEKYAGQVCSNYIQGKIIPKKQNIENVTFGAKRNLDDCVVDFKMPCYLMRRFFLALTPSYPRPMLKIHGELYEIVGKYEIINKEYYGPLGRVVNVDDRGVWIKIEDGYLIIKELLKWGTDIPIDAKKILKIGYRLNKKEIN